MKVGDIVRCKPNGATLIGGEIAIVLHTVIRRNRWSTVFILVKGRIHPTNPIYLEVVNEMGS